MFVCLHNFLLVVWSICVWLLMSLTLGAVHGSWVWGFSVGSSEVDIGVGELRPSGELEL